ncbi:MAG: PIN domain-containing protein [Nitrospirota bacterium]|nr:PIN domain-containing protein [Nitrospirota bacterium]
MWFFRGNQAARDFITDISYSDRAVSSLAVMELIQGCLNKEELKAVKEFIRRNISSVIYPDERISEKAMYMLEKHALSDGLGTVDALIVATAITKGSSLATANYKHFKNIHNLNILRFEP